MRQQRPEAATSHCTGIQLEAISALGAGLAQLVEHVICNHGVTGSSPVAGTNRINTLACFPIVEFTFGHQRGNSAITGVMFAAECYVVDK